MKKLIYSLIALAMAAGFVSCSEELTYKPAEMPTNEQIYFPSTNPKEISLATGSTSFEVTIARNTKELEAFDVDIQATGEGLEFFTVPGTVSFEEGESTAAINIAIDAEKIGMNNFQELILSIADEALTTPYGGSSLVLSVGISLPWIEFGKGVMHEDWWGEEEPDKVMVYQQISENMRLCKVVGCWGYETIKGGEDYEVQDYVWYWNTKTNDCFITPQYIGYTTDSGDVFVSTAAGFYVPYKGWDTGDDPIIFGTDSFFDWAAGWEKTNNFNSAYYDGNGTFYLADWVYLVDENGVPSGRGYQFGGAQDMFIADGFVRLDLAADVEYAGMFVSPANEAFAVLNFTGGADVPSIEYVITNQETDPAETVAGIVSGEASGISTIELKDGEASAKLAIEPGLYRAVIVPVGSDEELHPDEAGYIDFYFPGLTSPEEHKIEGELILMSTEELYGPETCSKNNLRGDNSFGFDVFVEGQIKSGKYYLNTAAVIAGWTGTLEELVAQYGSDIPEAQITKLNSEGEWYGHFSSRQPNTEYQMIICLEGNYGETLTLTGKYTTAGLPYSGSLVIGTYILSNGKDETPVTITNTATENIFSVELWEDGSTFKAVYDPDKNTVTMDGIEIGYEQYGCQFGAIYGYLNAARTQGYGYFTYSDPTDENAEGDDPVIITVDPSSNALSILNTEIDISAFDLTTSNPSYLGEIVDFPIGSTFTKPAPTSAPMKAAAKEFKPAVKNMIAESGFKSIREPKANKSRSEGWGTECTKVRRSMEMREKFSIYNVPMLAR